jgi:hypothetical protein
MPRGPFGVLAGCLIPVLAPAPVGYAATDGHPGKYLYEYRAMTYVAHCPLYPPVTHSRDKGVFRAILTLPWSSCGWSKRCHL